MSLRRLFSIQKVLPCRNFSVEAMLSSINTDSIINADKKDTLNDNNSTAKSNMSININTNSKYTNLNEENSNTDDCPSLRDTQHQIMVANILSRPPITLRGLSEFERLYEEYRHILQAESSRGQFDIITTRRHELEQLKDATSNASNEKNNKKSINTPEYELPLVYAEANKDPKSLMRQLDRKLYFVVKDELGVWKFPSKPVPNAQIPMHQLSAEVMRELIGDACEVYNVGRAPLACYFESLSDRTAPPLGIKTFFFKSQLINGTLGFSSSASARTWAWLTKEELGELLPPPYYEQIGPILSF